MPLFPSFSYSRHHWLDFWRKKWEISESFFPSWRLWAAFLPCYCWPYQQLVTKSLILITCIGVSAADGLPIGAVNQNSSKCLFSYNLCWGFLVFKIKPQTRNPQHDVTESFNGLFDEFCKMWPRARYQKLMLHGFQRDDCTLKSQPSLNFDNVTFTPGTCGYLCPTRTDLTGSGIRPKFAEYKVMSVSTYNRSERMLTVKSADAG